MTQKSDPNDHNSLHAKIEKMSRFKAALERISYHYDNQDMSHLDFRVYAATQARAAISETEPGEGAYALPGMPRVL